MCVCDREKDEDEGVPSETEEDRRQHESRTKEIRGEKLLSIFFSAIIRPTFQVFGLTGVFACVVSELLRRKDEQIISLLEEKVHIFRDLCDCNLPDDGTSAIIRDRMLFRATPDDITKGEPIMKDALREGQGSPERIHAFIHPSLRFKVLSFNVTFL